MPKRKPHHKIVVCSIMKDEPHEFIKRWHESALEADWQYLLDTGSSNGCDTYAESLGITVLRKTFTPWRFDVSRNHLLENLPDDADYMINLDVDEVLVAGWREKMDAVDPSITRPRYKYTWSWKPDGTEGLVYAGDKIVKRHGYRFKHPVHEVMIGDGTFAETQIHVEGLEIHHHPDNTKSRGQYLPLLLLAVEEDPEDDRNMYYCARELFFAGQVEQATQYFKNHLSLPRAVWQPERAASMRYLAKMNEHEREHWLLRACAEYPAGREPWVDLAQHYYNVNNWPGCFFAATQALRIAEKPLLYLNEAEPWGYWPHDLAAISAHRLGMHENALASGQIATLLNPGDERLKNNMFFYKDVNTKVNVVIPFKSHVVGLICLLSDLALDKKVNKIVIVADGEEAFTKLNNIDIGMNIVKVMVPEGSGIHVMWNLGMEVCGKDHAIAFINDDVRLGKDCMTILAAELDKNPNIGLISPNYSGDKFEGEMATNTTCRGRYDGTGGMAGFCFMLASDLVKVYKFDTSLKWWYGDDDIVNWTILTKNRLVIVTDKTSCVHYHSFTITNNPPKDFQKHIINDEFIFTQKWTN